MHCNFHLIHFAISSLVKPSGAMIIGSVVMSISLASKLASEVTIIQFCILRNINLRYLQINK